MTDRPEALQRAIAGFREDLKTIDRGELPRICEPINQWPREPWDVMYNMRSKGGASSARNLTPEQHAANGRMGAAARVGAVMSKRDECAAALWSLDHPANMKWEDEEHAVKVIYRLQADAVIACLSTPDAAMTNAAVEAGCNWEVGMNDAAADIIIRAALDATEESP